MACSKCWSQTPKLYPARPKGDMTRETFYSIILELAQAPFKPRDLVVGFQYGGESLLHPHFREFAEAAKQMHFKELGLATNGTLLNKSLNSVLLNNFSALAISLHKGPLLQESIDNAVALVEQRGKGCYEPNIRANLVIEEFTQQERDEVTGQLSGKVDGFRAFSYISEDMQAASYATPLDTCPSPMRYMAILWNGDTLPCCHILSPGPWSLGNINETSILEVWNGPAYASLRDRGYAGTHCERCQVKRL